MASMKAFVFFALVLRFEANAQISPGPGVVTLFYATSWKPAFCHYNDGYGWTVPPGIAMAPSTNSSFPSSQWQTINIPANTLTFLFNDGQGHWDHSHNNGGNFEVGSPGIYGVQNDVQTTYATFSEACAGNCSGNGVCDNSTYVCKCLPGYFGRACQGECPGGAADPCSGHGTCNDGAFGDGSCTCFAPWVTCANSSACSVDPNTDVDNCGQCNSPCKVGPGVITASCVNGTCDVTCQSGWIDCYGQCQQGDQCQKPPLPGCQTFQLNQCSGNNIVTPDQFDASRWWTPRPGDAGYLPSYQDYYRLVGHAHLEYTADLMSCLVQVVLIGSNQTQNTTYKYVFGSVASSNNSMVFTSPGGSNPIKTPLSITVTGSDGSQLVLDDVDFVWNAPTVVQWQPGDFRNGQKGAIVELFGWPHSEIEAECSMLSKAGYLGFKVYPAQEQVMSYQPFNNMMNPWYFMYQPVSYKLQGRMGSRDELRQLIQTCRGLGVRVYADAVVNHMTGGGNDGNPQHRNGNGNSCTTWPNKTTSNPQPSPFYTQDFAYTYNQHTGQPPSQEFPGVPYGPLDFHCERPLNSWNDPLDLNAGWLSGLVDLNTERDNVQERIADYMTDLLSIGFSGFRVDAAKHMQPDDLVAIFGKLRRNLGGALPADFITWWEILLGGEAEMLMCNAQSGYNYGQYLTQALLSAGFSQDDVNKIKIWNSGYPKEPDADCGSVDRVRNVVQNDDSDQQTPGSTSRDMGDQGTVLVLTKDVPLHRSFEVKLFTNPNGITDNDNDYPIRNVLSSHYWTAEGSLGIPDGLSDCSLCTTTCDGCQTVSYAKAQDPNSCGYDGLNETNPYTRVHRDRSIIMAMRSWMHMDTNVSNAAIGLPDGCQ
eukprot:TRINITY_DN8669_c0_g1_i1.p1 TRINITY_DN8669_c0_g1~~TRINITY_DN8669_c0_g1_i1.p1  ORF type:complete len:872 (-),score=231.66 TRINITY_DN8669_c0_g1_i1:183-2798(-)